MAGSFLARIPNNLDSIICISQQIDHKHYLFHRPPFQLVTHSVTPFIARYKFIRMCVDYLTTTIFSQGCKNPDCNKVQVVPGPDCLKKPENGPRTSCRNYQVRHGASNRVRGKCPTHRVVPTSVETVGTE